MQKFWLPYMLWIESSQRLWQKVPLGGSGQFRHKPHASTRGEISHMTYFLERN
jgi:hypothetical protein